jgi:hypothetical protein
MDYCYVLRIASTRGVIVVARRRINGMKVNDVLKVSQHHEAYCV